MTTTPEVRTSTRRTGRTAVMAAAGAAALLVPGAIALASSTSTASTMPVTYCNGPEAQTLVGVGHHDHGLQPYVMDIHKVTTENPYYRDTYWTGTKLQLTVMSIKPGDDIGLEMHPMVDQFLRIERGTATIKMGKYQNKLDYVRKGNSDTAILVPAGTWHDVINTGTTPLKVYSIYAPPNHPRNTLHKTKQDAANDPLEKIKCPKDVEAK